LISTFKTNLWFHERSLAIIIFVLSLLISAPVISDQIIVNRGTRMLPFKI